MSKNEYNNNEHFCYERKQKENRKKTESKKQKIKKTVGKCTLCMITVHSRKLA